MSSGRGSVPPGAVLTTPACTQDSSPTRVPALSEPPDHHDLAVLYCGLLWLSTSWFRQIRCVSV